MVVHRGRVDYTVKSATKKKSAKLEVTPEELTSNNKEAGGLRGRASSKTLLYCYCVSLSAV